MNSPAKKGGAAAFMKKAFPVPHALLLSDVSVSLADGALKFFQFSRSQGSLKPKAWGILPFPRVHMGAKEEKTDKAASEVAAALSAFASSHGFQAVKAIIHEGDAYAFKMKVPTTVLAEIGPAVESALEENVPIPPSDALFEYDVIAVDQSRGESSVAVSVVSEKVVYEYLRVLESGSLVPVSFETESRAMARALVPLDDQAIHAALVIKGHHSVVFVIERGAVTFSSSIDVGMSDLARAVEKTLNIGHEEALAVVTGASSRPEADSPELFDALLPVFATIRDELSKVLSYLRTESIKSGGREEVADIILAGSASRIPGFIRYVSLSSKLPARIGSVWTNVLSPDKEVPGLDERSSLDYASVIGAHL